MDAIATTATLDLAEDHFAAGRLSEAEPLFRRVLGVSGDDVRVLHFLGYIARQKGDLAGAAESYAAATVLDPHNAQLLNNLGEVQRIIGHHSAAIESYRRAVALSPGSAEIHFNLGSLLHVLHDEEAAVASLSRAIAIRPDLIEARSDIAPALCALNRYPEALEQYRAVMALQPDNHNARYMEALALLALGDFEQGWEKHESRWRSSLAVSRRRSFPQPYWLGESDIAGTTILLHAEQGLGDTLQFVRYAPLVAARGAHVLLNVQAELAPLLTGMPGVADVFTHGETLPPFDLHCSLMSLPRAFRTTVNNIPADVPYLHVPTDRLRRWHERLGAGLCEHPAPRRIGLAWAGSKGGPWNRDIALSLLSPLLQRTGCEFHVLQVEVGDADRSVLAAVPKLVDHSADLVDFADTAALVSHMDMVIAVDTAVAHLAGALGKPIWLLLPLGTDYRWMIGRPDSPWYPTMRLFRQPAFNDWQSVVAAVMQRLDAWP